MAGDWYILKKILWHTLNNGAAIASFIGLSWLTKRGIGPGLLQTLLDTTEGIVLIVLVLMFASIVIYDLLPEKVRGLFTSKLVFA